MMYILRGLHWATVVFAGILLLSVSNEASAQGFQFECNISGVVEPEFREAPARAEQDPFLPVKQFETIFIKIDQIRRLDNAVVGALLAEACISYRDQQYSLYLKPEEPDPPVDFCEVMNWAEDRELFSRRSIDALIDYYEDLAQFEERRSNFEKSSLYYKRIKEIYSCP